MTTLKYLLPAIGFLLALSSCGGGGGSGVPNFAGVYDVTLQLVDDTCQLNMPGSMSVRQTVNQDGERIVVNSGTIVAVGEVNKERDGFTAYAESRNGNCLNRSGVGYFMTDAAGFDYGVGLLITSRCGPHTCEVGYGGRAREVR